MTDGEGWTVVGPSQKRSARQAKRARQALWQMLVNCVRACYITNPIPNNKGYRPVNVYGNEILLQIMINLWQNMDVGRTFQITPDLDKYKITVLSVSRTKIILRQSHLHTDSNRPKGQLSHTTRYVKIVKILI